MAASAWSVRVVPSADKELDSLPSEVVAHALTALTELKEDPFHSGTIEVKGLQQWRRAKFGVTYRIVYRVNERDGRLLVLRIRHRRDAYRGLEPLMCRD